MCVWAHVDVWAGRGAERGPKSFGVGRGSSPIGASDMQRWAFGAMPPRSLERQDAAVDRRAGRTHWGCAGAPAGFLQARGALRSFRRIGLPLQVRCGGSGMAQLRHGVVS